MNKHSSRKDWLRLINSLDGKDRSKSRQPKKNKKPCRSKTPARHDNKTDSAIIAHEEENVNGF